MCLTVRSLTWITLNYPPSAQIPGVILSSLATWNKMWWSAKGIDFLPRKLLSRMMKEVKVFEDSSEQKRRPGYSRWWNRDVFISIAAGETHLVRSMRAASPTFPAHFQPFNSQEMINELLYEHLPRGPFLCGNYSCLRTDKTWFPHVASQRLGSYGACGGEIKSARHMERFVANKHQSADCSMLDQTL